MPDRKILYLSEQEVSSLGITMPEIIDALKAAFREHGEGRVEMPPKPGVHSGPTPSSTPCRPTSRRCTPSA